MKMKIGNTLFSTRENRKLTQNEMAELLRLSTSAYSRLERNETSAEVAQIVDFARILNLSPQDFLPETLSMHNSHNDNAQVGFVIGNFYSYSNEALVKENEILQEKVKSLENEVLNLKEIIQLLKR